MKIAILGKEKDVLNYVSYVRSAGIQPFVTQNPEELCACDALLLPGGGDITPAFFGETNHGSRNIDTQLDIRQMQAFSLAVKSGVPVLGVCKGLQIINVALGGTILQDLPLPSLERHQYETKDKYHSTVIRPGSWLHRLYGEEAVVNSAHHQALGNLGRGLVAVQHCQEDNCIEAVSHESLPIIGVQWHPERISEAVCGTNGQKVLAYLSSLVFQAS